MESIKMASQIACMATIVSALMLAGCGRLHHELSDDEWCRSFDYREGSREYTECRARIDRQRQRGEPVRR